MDVDGTMDTDTILDLSMNSKSQTTVENKPEKDLLSKAMEETLMDTNGKDTKVNGQPENSNPDNEEDEEIAQIMKDVQRKIDEQEESMDSLDIGGQNSNLMENSSQMENSKNVQSSKQVEKMDAEEIVAGAADGKLSIEAMVSETVPPNDAVTNTNYPTLLMNSADQPSTSSEVSTSTNSNQQPNVIAKSSTANFTPFIGSNNHQRATNNSFSTTLNIPKPNYSSSGQPPNQMIFVNSIQQQGGANAVPILFQNAQQQPTRNIILPRSSSDLTALHPNQFQVINISPIEPLKSTNAAIPPTGFKQPLSLKPIRPKATTKRTPAKKRARNPSTKSENGSTPTNLPKLAPTPPTFYNVSPNAAPQPNTPFLVPINGPILASPLPNLPSQSVKSTATSQVTTLFPQENHTPTFVSTPFNPNPRSVSTPVPSFTTVHPTLTPPVLTPTTVTTTFAANPQSVGTPLSSFNTCPTPTPRVTNTPVPPENHASPHQTLFANPQMQNHSTTPMTSQGNVPLTVKLFLMSDGQIEPALSDPHGNYIRSVREISQELEKHGLQVQIAPVAAETFEMQLTRSARNPGADSEKLIEETITKMQNGGLVISGKSIFKKLTDIQPNGPVSQPSNPPTTQNH